jgi:hypothetical protein
MAAVGRRAMFRALKEVMIVPTEILTEEKRRTLPAENLPSQAEELREAARAQAKRVRRLKINVAGWVLGTIVLTTLWVLNQWDANGAFRHFGFEGNPGDWSPTLWALAVGIWGLIVGIMALRVRFERPPTAPDVDDEAERLARALEGRGTFTTAEVRRFARARLERVGRLKFHISAWVLGMVVLTPLWALIEWQDNGGFQQWSTDGNRGDWEPWILAVGGTWALVIAALAVRTYVDRPTTEEEIDRELRRLT